VRTLFIFFFSMILVLAVQTAWAEPYRREVEFEWDAIEGAQTYDLELVGKKTLTFQTRKAQWSGKLAPGSYRMRVRAKDHRGVPAQWSPVEEFRVGLETPQLVSPKQDEKLETNELKKAEIVFEWSAVGATKKYVFEVSEKGGEVIHKAELSETKITVKLPVAKEYSWKVTALGQDLQSDEPLQAQMILLAQKLEKPQIEKPESDFVREIKWTPDERAQHYDFAVQRFHPQKKVWEKISEQTDFTGNQLDFAPQWPGGNYKIALGAKGHLTPSSETTEIKFKVRHGDRSPAAEETTTLRQSIDRISGWYGIASYLITMMDYTGVNFDRSNSILSYSAIGGTGRLGLGYLSTKQAWGFLTIGDMSGLTVEGGGTYTFASLEANAIHRKVIGTRGELRNSIGVFYKELPETIGRSASAISETNLLKTMGPHYGVEYWHAFSARLGMQINGHLYPSLLKLATPNDQNIVPTLSSQLGLLGSYKIKRNITGLIGYAFRQDRVDYRAQSGLGSAQADDLNSVKISGHYLNLFLEWTL